GRALEHHGERLAARSRLPPAGAPRPCGRGRVRELRRERPDPSVLRLAGGGLRDGPGDGELLPRPGRDRTVRTAGRRVPMARDPAARLVRGRDGRQFAAVRRTDDARARPAVVTRTTPGSLRKTLDPLPVARWS